MRRSSTTVTWISRSARPRAARARIATAPRRRGEIRRRRWRLETATGISRGLAPSAGGALLEPVVGPHDRRDQVVPDDVSVVEVDELDAVEALQHRLDLDQARRAAGRQVDLGDVA